MKRKIETHHYAARLNEDFLQCAVYDSDQPNARLIGNTLVHSLAYPKSSVLVRTSMISAIPQELSGSSFAFRLLKS